MTAAVQCYACDRFRFKSADPRMATCGFGNCQFKASHEYVSAVFPRTCDRFHSAPEAIAAERKKFLETRKEKSK